MFVPQVVALPLCCLPHRKNTKHTSASWAACMVIWTIWTLQEM